MKVKTIDCDVYLDDEGEKEKWVREAEKIIEWDCEECLPTLIDKRGICRGCEDDANGVCVDASKPIPYLKIRGLKKLLKEAQP